MDAEPLEVVHLEEVGTVSRLQQPHGQTVMPHGIDACRPQHVEQVAPAGPGPADELVDVAHDELVGMLVVAAEHAAVGMRVDQAGERVEVAGGGPLADQDLQAERDFFERLVECHAFVVGADPGGRVGSHGGASKPRGVAVHRLAAKPRRRDLGEHLPIAGDHAGIVHHLGEIADLGAIEQRRHAGCVNHRPGVVERRGGHAGWRAKVKRER